MNIATRLFNSSLGKKYIMAITGFGMVGDIIIGIVGAFIAAWLFPTLGLRLGGGGQQLLDRAQVRRDDISGGVATALGTGTCSGIGCRRSV